MEKGLNDDGHEWCCIIVMVAVHMGVGLNLGVDIGFTKEKELPLRLWDSLAPQV